jgi:hypothetical protein
MKSANPTVSLFLFFAIGGFCMDIYAETSPNEIFKKATKLDCIFTSEQQTRWGSRGLMKEEGTIQGHITFHSIDHQTKQAKVTYYNEDGPYPVRFHEWPAAMTFFELLENGELYPIITTVLDEYYIDTKTFIAVRSSHGGSAFNRFLVRQQHGTCTLGKWWMNGWPQNETLLFSYGVEILYSPEY